MNFVERLQSLVEQKGITRNKLLVDLNLGKNSFINWENRGTIPNGETLSKIAQYFDVSIDYLLTGEPPEQKIIPPEIEQSVSSEEKKKAPLVWGYDDDSVGWVHINTKKDKTNISENLDVESQNELDIELFKLIQQLPDSEKYKLIGRIQTTLELLK